MTACPKCGFSPTAIVTASWTFEIPRAVESGNARIVNTREHNWAYQAKRQGWEWDMLNSRRVHRVLVAVRRRRVTLTRLVGKRCRMLDADNLAAGMKIPLDAMKSAGLIVDDSPKWLEVSFAQERAPASGLRVLVEELAAVTSGLPTQCGKEQP